MGVSREISGDGNGSTVDEQPRAKEQEEDRGRAAKRKGGTN